MQHLEGSGTPVLYIGRTVLIEYSFPKVCRSLPFQNSSHWFYFCSEIAVFFFYCVL
jgi:hypothetical protein